MFIRIKNIEFGIFRNGQGKLAFNRYNVDKSCGEGCTIIILGCFFFTILRGQCLKETK